MIAPLRRGHRVIFVLLGVLLPLFLALAFAARREPPVATPLPSELAAGASEGAHGE